MHDEPYCQCRVEQSVLVLKSKLYTRSPCEMNLSGASSHTVAWCLVINELLDALVQTLSLHIHT